MPYALGIDLGTTSVKGVALDASGHVVATARAPHDLDTPRPGWAEADPDGWWDNVVRVTRAIGERVPLADVVVAGVSGMTPALVLLGGDGQVLRPSIQQNDGRTGEELVLLADRLDAKAFFAATGQAWSQQLVPPKLLWLRRHEPDIYRRIARVLGSYDYVTWRLTGASCLEQNWALEAGLWEAAGRRWHRPMLDAAEIPAEWLAPVRAPHEVIGGVMPAAATATGLAPGTAIIAGSADHVAAALAAGTGPGELVLKIGGAGDVLYGLDRFAPDPRLYIDYHDLPGAFLLNGCMATSGSLVKWLAAECARDLGAGGDVYARLDAEAALVSAGSDGLVVLPYFLGEKTPLLDPDARGVFFGLTLSHGRGHLHRAVLEAVAYGFRHHVEILEAAGHRIRTVRVMDGGARSPLWRQIIADVLAREIEYAPGADLGSAHGTAWLAGAAHGLWPWRDLPIPRDGVITQTPDPGATARYQPLYAIYRNLYTHLREDFTSLRRAT